MTLTIYGKVNAMFSEAELRHIRAALIIMRDIDAANGHDDDAQISAEIILKIEDMGVQL